MDFPIDVPLKRPVVIGEETFSRLTFDEPDLGTTIAVEEQETPWDQTVVLLAGMAGVSRDVLLKVKESDFGEITKRVLAPYQEHIKSLGQEAGNGTESEPPKT